jgi:hypothetical protein
MSTEIIQILGLPASYSNMKFEVVYSFEFSPLREYGTTLIELAVY